MLLENFIIHSIIQIKSKIVFITLCLCHEIMLCAMYSTMFWKKIRWTRRYVRLESRVSFVGPIDSFATLHCCVHISLLYKHQSSVHTILKDLHLGDYFIHVYVVSKTADNASLKYCGTKYLVYKRLFGKKTMRKGSYLYKSIYKCNKSVENLSHLFYIASKLIKKILTLVQDHFLHEN